MANALYDSYVNSYMTQAANQVDLDSGDIRAILVDGADYTPNLATHDFLDDVPMAARVSVVALANKTVTGRVFDADDTTFPNVSGDQFEYVILYNHTGVEGTSRLIALFDTATGLPMTPSGSDIIAQWDNGANKIFRL
jgi:hypothetical protein